VRDQVSHPYKTTGKIIALYILIFIVYGKLDWQRTFLDLIPANMDNLFRHSVTGDQ
jgi:hypothetical protein